jgi:histidyl-tRNA synthetase
MGDVVLTELLKERGLLPKFGARLDVFCLIEDEALRAGSLNLVQRLREAGLAVDYPLTSVKPDKQFKRALELEASFAVSVVGANREASEVKIKNLKTREEVSRSADDAVKILRGDK